MTGPRRSRSQRLGAPALFVFLWSTGFVGAQFGLPHAEPLTFLGVRMVIAAALLAGIALAVRAARPSGPAQYGHSAVVGVLLHAGYLGGVFVAISLGVPAPVSAVVVGLQPVLTVVLAGPVLGERATPRQWLGLALGVAGVAVVLSPGLAAAAGQAGAVPPQGLVACLVALAAGTAGTVHQKRYGGGVPMLWGTAVQYTAAAAVLLPAAAATERMSIRWTGEFLLAMVWLVLALSLGAVLLLLLLLRRGTAAEVSSLLYLVPPAVTVEAWLLFGTVPAPVSVAGIVVTALGVALVVVPPRRTAAVRRTARQ